MTGTLKLDTHTHMYFLISPSYSANCVMQKLNYAGSKSSEMHDDYDEGFKLVIQADFATAYRIFKSESKTVIAMNLIMLKIS